MGGIAELRLMVLLSLRSLWTHKVKTLTVGSPSRRRRAKSPSGVISTSVWMVLSDRETPRSMFLTKILQRSQGRKALEHSV